MRSVVTAPLFLMLLSLAAIAQVPQFAEVSLDHPPTTAALTPDGKYLVIAHEQAGKITVLNVVDNTVAARIDCPSPRFILCRADSIFVACFGDAMVRRFSVGDWKQTAELRVSEQPIYLSAPQAQAFADQLLVACNSVGSRRHIMLADFTTRSARLLLAPGWNGFPNFSADGKTVRFGDLDRPTAEVLAGDKSTNIPGQAGAPYYPAGSSNMLFGEGVVLLDDPAKTHALTEKPLLDNDSGTTIVWADQARPLFYVLHRGMLKAKSVNDLRDVAITQISIPDGLASIFGRDGLYGRISFTQNQVALTAHPPLAVTRDGKLYLYVIDSGCRASRDNLIINPARLYSCVLKPVVPDGRHISSPLEHEHVATSMALSEDGRSLLLAHQEANLVTAWDVTTGKQTAAIECPSPRHIICRGDKAFVACFTHGKIKVLQQKDKWELAGEIMVGHSGVRHLAAPAGKFFRDQILAVCGDGTTNRTMLIDIAGGKATELLNHAAPVLSYDGRSMGVSEGQASISSRFTHVVDLAAGKFDKSFGSPFHFPNRLFFVSQNADTAFWFGRNVLYWGQHPYPLWNAGEALVIADQNVTSLVYSLDDLRLSARQLDAAVPLVGERSVVGPQPRRASTAGRTPGSKTGPTLADHRLPLAVTLDKDLFVFVQDHQGTVHRMMTDAFPQGAYAAVEAADGEFATLPLADMAAHVAMTEDGKHLLVAHWLTNAVSVWDVRTGRHVAQIPCPSPVFVLCRGNKVFAANGSSNTVTVINANTWKVVDQLKAPNQVDWLSAPGGKAFAGKLMAAGRNEVGPVVAVIDVARDTCATIFSEENRPYLSTTRPAVDYAGAYVIEFPVTNMSSFRYSDYLAGKLSKSDVRSERVTRPLYQHRPVDIWFGPGGMLVGRQLKATGPAVSVHHSDPVLNVIPEVNTNHFLVLSKDKLSRFMLNAALTEVGTTGTSVPDHSRFRNIVVGESPSINIPLAATHNGTTCAFIPHPDGRISRISATFGAIARTPVVLSPAPGEWPAKVAVGQKIAATIPAARPETTCTLAAGPAGATLSADGKFLWTPTIADVGVQELKIRLERGDNVSFERYRIEVVVATVAGSVGRDKPGTLPILIGNCQLGYSHDWRNVLLLSGQELIVLDADGREVVFRTATHATLLKIFDRPKYYVAANEESLFLLDKKTLKPIKTIELPHKGVTDLAIHPFEAISYVCVLDGEVGDRINGRKVLKIDEESGKAEVLPRLYGQRLAVDPTGRFLYVGLNEIYRDGYIVDFYYGSITPAFGSIDILAAYNISGRSCVFAGVNLSPGSGLSKLCVSPDGRSISYVSGGGYRDEKVGSNIPSFDAARIDQAQAAYSIAPPPADVAFHPALDLAAACSARALRIFQRSNGRHLLDALPAGLTVQNASLVLFSPSGRYLMFDTTIEGRRTLCTIPLKLSGKDIATIATPPQPPVPANVDVADSDAPPAAATFVRADEIDALRAVARVDKVTPKQIGRDYMDSVVIIETVAGSGTGFFVGRNGYIITCAHTLARIGDTVVSYRQPGPGGEPVIVKARANIVRVDADNDLALLQIASRRPVKPVAIGVAATVEAGEAVTVIGHPGLGERTLSYTMTTGVVSNPNQVIADLGYLQTNATVNPGSSGSPVFDSQGRAIGLVVLKAGIEGTGFAVPLKRIQTFLTACTVKTDGR